MMFNSKILKLLKQELRSQANFEQFKTVAIGEHTVFGVTFDSGLHAKDAVNEYTEYLKKYKTYRSIQVLGLEHNKRLMNAFKYDKGMNYKKLLNVCLFYSPTKTYSFNKHWDDYKVVIYVVKGRKKVIVGTKVHYVKAGEFIRIPKRVYHQVFNDKDTWAVSFAYD